VRIVGPDELIFGVDNIEASKAFLRDYGLVETDEDGRFAALDGTALTVRAKDDDSLPAPLGTATMLRQTVWGVEDQASLDAIEAELSKDRDVSRDAAGRVLCKDDVNFEIAFQVTMRKELSLPAEMINSPGAVPGRPANVIGADEDAEALPRTLSHVVYFVPDMEKAAKFYTERLGFVVTDQFTNTGPFLRPQANDDHHVLFMIQTPDYMQGLEHVAFGSNWFWYFNAPLGAHIEYDADMDKHDGDWIAREAPIGKETAQMFLFENVEKWAPGGPPPDKD